MQSMMDPGFFGNRSLVSYSTVYLGLGLVETGLLTQRWLAAVQSSHPLQLRKAIHGIERSY
jgi:hypothetical protein